jgi:hypothetical protein
MTSITLVTIDARFSVYFSPGVPDLGSKAYFIANPRQHPRRDLESRHSVPVSAERRQPEGAMFRCE